MMNMVKPQLALESFNSRNQFPSCNPHIPNPEGKKNNSKTQLLKMWEQSNHMLEIYPQSHRRPLTAEYTLFLHASEEAGAVINTSILSCSTPHSDESRARRRRAPKPWARGSGQTGGSECAVLRYVEANTIQRHQILI